MLFVYTWLLDNRTLLLLVKAALQVQFCNPVQMHPTWSLPFFVVFLCCLNIILALAHLWAPANKTNTGDAIFIDFVGQSVLPDRVHMLLIDATVCFVQLLMTIVAFETGKDQVRPDGEPSALDDLTSPAEDDEMGQGWDVRDEEAAVFGLDEEEERKRERTSLTHHIAVVRLRPIYDQIVARQFLPDHPAERVASPVASCSPIQPPSEGATLDRPDTSRLRRFSRRAQASNPTPSATTSPDTQRGLGPVSADTSWPPMWVIIARNMVGGNQARSPTFRPLQGLTSLRERLTGRFGRTLSHSLDLSQYTRLNPDAPPET